MRKVKTRIKTDRFHGDGREGGSLLYVIFFITLLSVFACGFMAVSRYHIKMALKNRAYMEARLTTHMIHNSFCEAVSKGESDALRFLWNQYEGDLEDEEAEENENEDIPETEGAGADGITKLAYWKKNGNIPKWDTVENIAKYLGVSADYLLGNEQKKSTPTDSADAEADRLFEQVKQLPLEKQQQAFDYLRFLLGQQDKH